MAWRFTPEILQRAAATGVVTGQMPAATTVQTFGLTQSDLQAAAQRVAEHAAEPSGFKGFIGDVSRFVPVLSSFTNLVPGLVPEKVEWPVEVSMNGWGDIFSGVQQGLQLYQQVRSTFDYPEQEYPQPGGPDIVISGGGEEEGGGMVRTAGGGGALVGAAVSLGALLARTLGKGIGSRILTGVNQAGQAVKVRLDQLWPLVRKYSPEIVAAGMGWTAAELAGHLTAAARYPSARGRGRGRGISAAQLRNARRTLKTIRKMYFMLPTRRAAPGRVYYHRHRR